MLPRWTFCLLPLFLFAAHPSGASEGANPYAVGDFYGSDSLPGNGAPALKRKDLKYDPFGPGMDAPTIRLGFTAHRDFEEATIDGVSHSVSSGCCEAPPQLMPLYVGGPGLRLSRSLGLRLALPWEKRFCSQDGPRTTRGVSGCYPVPHAVGDFGPYPEDFQRLNPYLKDFSDRQGSGFRLRAPCLP